MSTIPAHILRVRSYWLFRFYPTINIIVLIQLSSVIRDVDYEVYMKR